MGLVSIFAQGRFAAFGTNAVGTRRCSTPYESFKGRSMPARRGAHLKVKAQGLQVEEPSEKEMIRDNYWAAEAQAREAPWKVVPGLQSFFAAVLERKRRIPSQLYKCPITTLFEEFDLDGDGHLTAEEATSALHSRNVMIPLTHMQAYFDRFDQDKNGTIELREWLPLVQALATDEYRRESFRKSQDLDG
eukprot:jgi/Botrbrau1/9653/Bobra.0131s0028.1